MDGSSGPWLASNAALLLHPRASADCGIMIACATSAPSNTKTTIMAIIHGFNSASIYISTIINAVIKSRTSATNRTLFY